MSFLNYLCSMIIHNRYIPTKKFYAINRFGVIFVRHGVHLLTLGMRHPKYFFRSNKGLMARCSSLRKRVLVSFC